MEEQDRRPNNISFRDKSNTSTNDQVKNRVQPKGEQQINYSQNVPQANMQTEPPGNVSNNVGQLILQNNSQESNQEGNQSQSQSQSQSNSASPVNVSDSNSSWLSISTKESSIIYYYPNGGDGGQNFQQQAIANEGFGQQIVQEENIHWRNNFEQLNSVAIYPTSEVMEDQHRDQQQSDIFAEENKNQVISSLISQMKNQEQQNQDRQE